MKTNNLEIDCLRAKILGGHIRRLDQIFTTDSGGYKENHFCLTLDEVAPALNISIVDLARYISKPHKMPPEIIMRFTAFLDLPGDGIGDLITYQHEDDKSQVKRIVKRVTKKVCKELKKTG